MESEQSAELKTQIVTLEERPELRKALDSLHTLGWPAFIRKDVIAGERWEHLLNWYPDYQYFLLDEEQKVVACGHAIPFNWSGQLESLPQGWEAVFEKGLTDYETQLPVNAASALAIVIHPDQRGKGLSETMVLAMRDLVKSKHLNDLVAPLRPALKANYPLIPMKDYMLWKRDDGQPFDPWIRAHVRAGAEVLKVAERSTVIEGNVEEWEAWTHLKLLSTGHYVIPGGLVPLEVDLEKNRGQYVEPNVWIRHHLD